MIFKKRILLLVAALVSVFAGSASADRIHGYGDSRQRYNQTYDRSYNYPQQYVNRSTYVTPYYNSGYYNTNRYPVYNNRTYYPNSSYYNNSYYNNGYYNNGYYNNGYYNDRPGIQLGPVRLNF